MKEALLKFETKVKVDQKEEVKDERNPCFIPKSEENMKLWEKVNDLSKSVRVPKNICSVPSIGLEVVK